MSTRYIGGLVYNPPGGWSAQFNGSNYLSLTTNASLGLGTGAYTIECWVNVSSAPAFAVLFTVATGGIQFGLNASANIAVAEQNVDWRVQSSTAMPLNVWNHVAVSRDGSSVTRIYLNGVQIVSATDTTNYATGTSGYINYNPGNGNKFTGYISNVRVIKGTALYTSAFTPPTGALLPVSGTSLLTCRYPTIVDGSTNNFTITNNGTATVSTSNPFPTSVLPNPALGGAGNGIYTLSQYASLLGAGTWPAYDPYYENVTLNLHGNAGAVLPFNTDASTNNFQVTQVGDTRPSNYTPFIENGYWSNLFNGSSFETVAGSTNLAFGTGDFTIECWVNFNNVSSGNWLDMRPTSTNGLYPNLYVSSGTLAYYVSSADRITGGTVTAGTWYHIALCRSATSTKLFLNGTQVGSTYTDSNNYICGTNRPMVGGNGFSNAANFNGYVSNFRFVKGTALYTTTFTPPTTPLTAISGTSLLICQSNRFVDNSASPYTITTSGSPQVSPAQPFTAPTGTSAYGSGYFDGSGDYLSAPSSSAFKPASSDFTIEAWVFVSNTGVLQTVYGDCDSGTNNGMCELSVSSTLKVEVDYFTSSTAVVTKLTTGSIQANAWNHICVSKTGTTMYIGYNGTLETFTGVPSTMQSPATLYPALGRLGAYAGYYITGYISNFRFVVGSAVYTGSTYTVPISPLTAITNTSLLTVQTNAPSQNNTFLDSSTNNFVITRNGNTTQGTFTPYGATWSNAFATSAAIRYPYTSSLTSWWTQDFTMEMWIFNNTNAVSGTNSLPLQFAHGTYTAASTYWSFGTNASGQLNFYYYNGGPNNVTSTTTASLGTWNHIAMVYTHSSGNISLYLNGASVASATKSGTPQNYSGDTVNIGAVQSTYYNGYISNLRVLNGTALYTGTFTPSTAPLTAITNTQLLTCQSNRFVDNSTNNATPTLIGSPSVQRFSPFSPTTAYSTSVIGGSGYFDGSGDYLDAPSNTAFGYGTGNFTIEFWAYFTSISGSTPNLIDQRSGTSTQVVPTLYLNAGVFSYYVNGNNRFTGPTLVANQWYHIAVCRSSSTTTFYINGSSVGTYADSNNYITSPVRIFGSNDGVALIAQAGYCSNLRIVKGTAVYTSAFTPPTAPLTAISGTSLLLSYTNAGILDNAMMNDLETVGNAQISTSVKKYGTGSMYFDGSGDYLYAKNNDVFNFGTGDFTVEFWINASASGSYTQVIGTLVSGTEAGTWRIGNRFNSLNQLYFARGTGAGFNEFQASVNVNDGAWHHVAVVRYSGTVTIYADGVASGSSSITGTCTSSNPLYLGYNGRDNAYVTGYLDDVRITKGVARYTANFTPPTSQLQDQ